MGSDQNLAGRAGLRQAVLALYDLLAELAPGWGDACRPGCAICCTRAVTLTSLEAEILIAGVTRDQGPGFLAERLARVPAGPPADPGPSFNALAALCRQGQVEARRPPGTSAAVPGVCPFLAADRCQIYPWRPFACRCFASQAVCRPGGAALLPAVRITIHTIFLQVIEHLDQGGRWGRLVDLLPALLAGQADHPRLHPTAPIPGLFIPPAEADQVAPVVAAIMSRPVAGSGRTVAGLLRQTRQRPTQPSLAPGRAQGPPLQQTSTS
ncbi:MAG: hypothetical protein AB1634_07730 [Thermodesulfobacteriota bacterium]